MSGSCRSPVLDSPAMARNLVIVESPAKAKTIERYLGPDYTVLASYGHVRDLPENPGKGKFGVDVDHDFAPEYVVPEDRRKQVDQIAKAAKRPDAIYLATDLDREGEAIAWHVAEAADMDPAKTQRVTFNEITRGRRPGRVRPPAPDRHEPRRRPADAAHRGPARRLHAQPAAVAQGPRRPVGRSRAVGGGAHRRRPRARDPRASSPASTGRSRSPCARPTAWRSPPTSSASTAKPAEIGEGESAEAHAAALRDGAAGRRQDRHAAGHPQPGRRRSRRARSSRRRAASSASAPSGRCPSPSACTRASRPATGRPVSSRTCAPTRPRSPAWRWARPAT